MKKFITTTLLLAGILVQFAQAQIDTTFINYKLDFKKYLNLVSTNNLEYAAQKYSCLLFRMQP